jgi:hypothetical protein
MNVRNLIALGIDRNGQMWDDDFGMSPLYYIYDRAGNPVEKRTNPHAARPHHGNPKLIVDLLPECGVFIARKMGKPGMLEKLGIRPVITKVKDPLAALAAYLEEATSL